MKFLSLALAVLLFTAPYADAAKTKRTGRSSTSAKSGKTVKASASKKKKAGSKRSSRSSSSTQRARTSSPPRQSAPTPERYMEIQRALADKGHYQGEIDGVWDADCVEALRKFQAEQNLAPDGKLGSLSLIALGLGPKREPIEQSALPAPPPQP